MLSHLRPASIPLLSLFFAFLWAPGTVEGQFPTGDDWEWNIVPFVWAADISGLVSVAGQERPVDEDFSEILEKVDFSGSLGIVGRKGPWGIRLVVQYSNLVSESPFPAGGTAETRTKQLVTELNLKFRVLEFGIGDEGVVGIDALGGGRYWSQDTKIELVGGPLIVDQGDQWIDPLLGGEVLVRPKEKLTFRVRFDAAVAGESDETWGMWGRVDYQFWDHVGLIGGYNFLDVDYDVGQGMDRYLYSVRLHGPFAGLRIRF